jgi:hypothetical protein
MVTKINGTTGVDKVQNNTITTDNLPSGSILQIKSTLYSTGTSVSLQADTHNTLTQFSVSITPKSASSKILLLGRLFCEPTQAGWNDQTYYFTSTISTRVNCPAAAGVRNVGMSMPHIGYWADDRNTTPAMVNLATVDSPNTTSQITYWFGTQSDAAGTLYINRTLQDVDQTYVERGTSEIIAMEIAG